MSASDVMWKIQRVRLDRVGPSAARFLDVTLDMRDGGGHPLDTILWLRNGGGKSTVLSLICALIRPHRRDFLATAATGKHLEDYVLGADTAHVVVEWSGPSGRRLVTGAVYEWVDRTQPADPNRDHDRLTARWYLFTPTGSAELDQLPFSTEGQPTPLREFVAEIRRWDAIPGCGAAVTDGMDRWRRLLDDQGLDPEIFTPILQMNATEGGIEGQFQFRGADQFVQYLLELIVDPDVPGQVSQILEGVRAGLAERPELLSDLTFADEAVPRLRALAAARDDGVLANGALVAEQERARTLVGALATAATSAERAQEAGAEAARRHEQAADEHAAAETGARRAGRRLRRVAARLRLAAAEREGERLAQEEERAAAHLAAWRATPAVHALREAEQRAAQLEQQLAAATEDAEPLRRRRDEASAVYAAALDRSIGTLDDEATRLRDDAELELAQETAARRRGEEALAERAQLTAALTAAEQALAALDRDLAAAVTAGHLAPGESVAAATARHRAADEQAVAALTTVGEERAALGEERRRLQERMTSLGTERGMAEREREAVAARRGALGERIAELAADERLRALSGGAEIDPVAEAGDLADVLSQAIARTQRRRIELAVDGAEDERALAALATTELLPGSLDLGRAHDALERAGIAAASGWSYLADSVPADRHAAVLRAAPALATGLLVHDQRDLPAAREALADAGLRPTSAVVLATTTDLAAVVTAVTGGALPTADAPYLVPPAPALTDRAAAGAELIARERARADRSGVDAELASRHDGDTELSRRLRQLVADCPPGTLEALDASRAAVEERLAALAAESDRAEAALAALNRKDAALDEARAEAERTRRAAAAALGTLSGLGPREQDAAAHRDTVAALPGSIAACTKALAAEIEAEAAHRRLAAAAGEHAGALARTAQAQRADRASLGAVEAAPGSEVAVSEARAAWESASLAYRREVAESALASSLQEAARALERVREQVADVPVDVRAAAPALLDSPDGLDGPARTAATARAELARAEASTALADARAEIRLARAELDELTDRADQRDDPGAADEPATREAALAAAESAEQEADADRRRHDAAVAAVTAAAAEQAVARERATAMRHLVELVPLPEAEQEPSDAPVFGGTVEEARAAVDATRGALDAATVEERRSRRAVEKLGQDIALWAAADRFGGVKPAVRDRFRTDDIGRDLLPDAEQLAEDLGLFAAQLRERLDELEEHKGVVVTAMVGMVRQALKALSRAQSLSELPESLGEWAGQRFLEVGPRAAVETADAVLRERCARLVDALTTRGTPVPRGHELLWQATSAVVGEGNWKARVLKPSTTFAIERVPVERMRKWSGGEKVTISLLLFCTVAKLRATSRGREQPGLGALPLDNPLGKANYVVFLNLQRKVAAANGIQLIFLTGVGDLKAVGRFPNVIRMRNTRSKEREYVRVAERQVAAVDPAGVVDTTRVWREDPVLTLL